MEIRVSEAQGTVPITILHLSGRIRLSEDIEKTAREAYAAGTRHILFDLTDVIYMTSSALRGMYTVYMLLRGEKTQRQKTNIQKGINTGAYKSSVLKIYNPPDLVKDVLGVMGYDMFLEIHDDFDEAVASFS